MGRTVAELENTISAGEVDEWIAYNEIEPFGDWAAWARSAHQMAMTANINRDPKKTRPFTAADFMPQPRETATPADKKAAAEIESAKIIELFRSTFGDRFKEA